MRTSAVAVSMLAFLSLTACQRHATSTTSTDALTADLHAASTKTDLALAPTTAPQLTVVSPQEQMVAVPRAARTKRAPRAARHTSPPVTEVSLKLAPQPPAPVAPMAAVATPKVTMVAAVAPAPAEAAADYPDPANAGHVAGERGVAVIGGGMVVPEGRHGHGSCGGHRLDAGLPMCAAIPVPKY